ncbi:MAG: MerR family transcriptional regulator [Pseudomonadota bacterium]
MARLVGVSVHTLRKWEERYGAVGPSRTPGGGRRYTREDLDRLILIKKLADRGMSLAELANRPLSELGNIWEQLPDAPAPRHTQHARPIRVAVLGGEGFTGPADNARGDLPGPTQLACVASGWTLPDLKAALEDRTVDLLIYHVAVVSRSTDLQLASLLNETGIRHALVIYRYATRADLRTLRAPNIAVERAPVNTARAATLAQELLLPHGAGGTADHGGGVWALGDAYRAPRFSAAQIATLAGDAPSVECECPRHLAELLSDLHAFEQYSVVCKNRSDEDAELHHYLWQTAAHARALFEDAIERVARAEGIDLVVTEPTA